MFIALGVRKSFELRQERDNIALLTELRRTTARYYKHVTPNGVKPGSVRFILSVVVLPKSRLASLTCSIVSPLSSR